MGFVKSPVEIINRHRGSVDFYDVERLLRVTR